MATCPLNIEPQNNNGDIASKVMGIKTQEDCCEACAVVGKTCVQWVLGKSTNPAASFLCRVPAIAWLLKHALAALMALPPFISAYMHMAC
jgi:hypothetical protein